MRFYFDYQDLAGFILDEVGEELPDLAAARDAAMRYLAESIRDHSPSGLADTFCVSVRTKHTPIMTVLATIEVVAPAASGQGSTIY
ncbi:hypothetical protein ABIF68_006813 [Bradyrhizobium japonicum]